MFMMPTNQTYDDASNVTFASINRFMLSPSPQAPFFIRNDGGVATADWPSTVTNCGFLQQLLDSGAPAILAHPVPHFGTHAPNQRPLREVLGSLRRALHADELNAAPEIQATFKTAVASFSAATTQAVDILRDNQTDIHDFYWFEPNQQGGVDRSDIVENWVSSNAERRLRMIGTNQHAAVRQIAARVPPDRVSVFPAADFRKSPLYIAAVSVPPAAPPGQFPERLAPFAQRATLQPGHISFDRGIFLEADNGDTAHPSIQVAAVKDASGTSQVALAACTPEEAAGKARFGMLNHRAIGPGDAPGARLAPGTLQGGFIVRSITGEILSDGGSLHQWAVAGGLNDGTMQPARDQAKGFVGFLGLAMRGGALFK